MSRKMKCYIFLYLCILCPLLYTSVYCKMGRQIINRFIILCLASIWQPHQSICRQRNNYTLSCLYLYFTNNSTTISIKLYIFPFHIFNIRQSKPTETSKQESHLYLLIITRGFYQFFHFIYLQITPIISTSFQRFLFLFL